MRKIKFMVNTTLGILGDFDPEGAVIEIKKMIKKIMVKLNYLGCSSRLNMK